MQNTIKIFIVSMMMLSSIVLFSQEKGKSEIFENAQLIDATNAASFTNFENTPESVVSYFYASKIRNDEKWKEVILSERDRTPTLKMKLDDYEKWKFSKFKLISKEKSAGTGLWLTIFMEIEINGEREEETDQVTVQLINDKWIIVSVPN